ncbi:hypothetical protein BURPS1106B_2391 [Burkholderia pseudomallei 1106b]|uniref:Uncharacterized protein n=2 Tax=Burkholderia pseudomallei TaxID=28450 RepID=A0A0E1VPU8_BURPE|nr:hypothetical protein BURPS1106A_A2783 [Burkholderia pseudomallei 1106a]AFR20672.1 hypothetical protein BPC006_II2748 [Burkholderia pseudomallei BPC006]EBA49969.1 hypothetical protein BURPS305_6355 [Burkholderia pseudomallei 305]EES21697.1 hypothetical protein BURPS1106B_2391 [Burkholderia pseudomallei 1106b]EET02860.1 hypothetical protein BURPS1710A_A2072 [Burkholderia pseudomallei 1710a]
METVSGLFYPFKRSNPHVNLFICFGISNIFAAAIGKFILSFG